MGKMELTADSRTSPPSSTVGKGPGWIFLLAALLALAAQSPRGGSIGGVVTDPDGASLPGVEVTATSGEVERVVHTGVDGIYEIADLPAGTYELRARLDGFCGQERSGVRVVDRAPATVNFLLGLAPVNTERPHLIYLRLPDALRLADAVVHLRITKSYEPQLWGHSRTCGVVGIEHEGLLLAESMLDAVDWRNPSTIRLVQYWAGTWADDDRVVRGSERPYGVGAEYVLFLTWVPATERFRPFRGYLAIPVRDGRISWRGAEEPGVQDGMPVDDFLALLRGMRR
jgi:hypothetical protein